MVFVFGQQLCQAQDFTFCRWLESTWTKTARLAAKCVIACGEGTNLWEISDFLGRSLHCTRAQFATVLDSARACLFAGAVFQHNARPAQLSS